MMRALNSELPTPGLASARSTFRLNQIDRVRANGVGELVALPQLVVCGDQSAGKSSVLERVTGIPFPRQEGLCTRFPTEIILRHSNQPLSIIASIRPHSHRKTEEQQLLRSFSRHLAELSKLPDVINESAGLMGIRGFGTGTHVNAFARDVLRIEINGPVGLHLTIVDLPGLISVPNEEQTEEDVRIVNDLVEEYLGSTRTIIMAVVQASNDVANQRIIQLARKHDPAGQRTVGIITKPDLINDGAEAKIAMLARNADSVKLKLGFFLMKNPSPSENSFGLSWAESAEREQAFFAGPAWKDQELDLNRVGAAALQRFLQTLLDSHIEQELPKVREEIKRKLGVMEASLMVMGRDRPTMGQIRFFLTDVSMNFHRLAEAALDGNYQGPDITFFEQSGTRLRADLHKVNQSFAQEMRMNGQKRKISSERDTYGTNGRSTNENETQQLHVTQEEMKQWVFSVYEKTRGRELPGNYNHALLGELFHEQSSLWPSIAWRHLQTTLDMIAQWLVQASKACIQEDHVRQEIGVIWRDALDNVEAAARKELQRLLDDEAKHPVTYNHYYTDNVQKDRHAKEEAGIASVIAHVKESFGGKMHVSNVPADLERLMHAMRSHVIVDMDAQACAEALSGLKAYYKVAMKTFVDNVCRQVIERHLVAEMPILFCPNKVAAFSDEELIRIGSEQDDRKLRRAELQSLVDGLRKSLTDLQSAV